MFQKILVPLDGSELAERALRPACQLAQDAKGELLLLSVPFLKHAFSVEESTGVATLLPHQSVDQTGGELKSYLTELCEGHKHPDMGISTCVREGDEASVIVDTAAAEDVDLIMMSTHGRTGFSRWYLGSVTERVLRSSPCPVLVVRDKRPFSRILITLDGSLLSERALLPGFTLARCFKSLVTLLQVSQPEVLDPVLVDELEAAEPGLGRQAQEDYNFRVQRYLKTVADRHRHLIYGGVRTLVVPGPVAEAILETIEAQRIDLVVLATHGRTGLRRWVMGSIAEKVVRHAECSAMIVRPPKEALFG